jgi:hypothetical protein
MGGQACVSYGAAEFSRDVDLVLLADADNLLRLRAALDDLGAEAVAVPSLDLVALQRGHAVHFRCHAADGIRLDLMSTLRGVDPFPVLWSRRTTLEVEGESFELLSLPDLVKAKKTQRDKDWPMIRRLLEASYFPDRDHPTPEQLTFWLAELRTPEALLELVAQHPDLARRSERPAVRAARSGDLAGVEQALAEEQASVREEDRAYWAPLRAELEALRRGRGA